MLDDAPSAPPGEAGAALAKYVSPVTRAPRWTLAGGLSVAVLTWVATLRAGLDYDEGVYSQTLRLVAAGKPLVSDVFTSQPPLWPYLALPGWLAGGVTGTRLWIMVWALLGLLAVYRIARIYTTPTLAGVITVLVAASPAYTATAAAIEADLPALTLAMCALAVAMRPSGSLHSLPRLLAIGLLFGLALMVKLLVAPMVVVLIVAVLIRSTGRAAAVRDLSVLFLSAAVVVIAVGAAFWNHGDLWEQAVGFHVASQTFAEGLRNNLSTALNAPGTCAFLLLGAYAAVEIVRRHDPERLLLVAWFAATGVFLLVHVPLFTHHLVLAVPPAALLIVLELDKVISGRRLEVALVGLIVVSVVGSVIATLDKPGLATAKNNPVVAELRRLPTNAVLVTDDQALVTAADRSVAGPLVDTSEIRISSGDLTPAEVCTQIAKADAVLLTHAGRFNRLPGVAACTKASMGLTWKNAQATLYVRPGVALTP
jgi:4-amino-4-deoxy-L-arabinose transferase-like glycosyltransferase